MKDSTLKSKLGLLSERALRLYYSLKYLIRDWVRIPRESPLWMKVLLAGVYSIAFFLILTLAIDINLFWLFGRSPNVRELKNPNVNLTSEIYSADGKLIGTLYTENRTPAVYEDLPKNLVNTLIATEDVRFYKHHGVDIKATFAAMWSVMRGDRRGGSTITQQLVKNLFKTRKDYSTGPLGYIPGISTLISKAKEWIIAVKIELYYSKEDIITMYFNTVDFGSHAYGINSAASTFFSKKPVQLTYNESAVLVGLLKAPSSYSPVSNPERSLSRRNQVLGQLEKYGYISKPEEDSLIARPLKLHYQRKSFSKGNMTYLRDALVRDLQSWSKETGNDVWNDGLKIYTTIDSRMQTYAEEAVAEHMKSLQKVFDQSGSQTVRPWIDDKGKEIPGFFLKKAIDLPQYKSLEARYGAGNDSIRLSLSGRHTMRVFTFRGERDTLMSTLDSLKYYMKFFQTGFMAMEPNTGYIKAWVGGIDYKYFKFDHVNQSKRQPGSLFKAFVYTAAFDQGYGPCDLLTDQPVSIKYTEKGEEKEWSPKNVDRTHAGSMTLKYAFARSVNSIAVQLAQKIGWQKVIEYAHKLGVKSELAEVPSICLGSSDVTLEEMVNAYCTFVNDGSLVEPILVTRIEDRDGKVIYEALPKKKQVLNPETAFLMSIMLRGGLTEPGGTTQGLFEYDLFRYGTEFGGKTGTSSDYSDGWFVGVTPGLVAGCWVGNDDRSIHFKTSHIGEGLRTAQPVYGRFMAKVLKDESLKTYRLKFPKPAIKISKPYNCQTVLPKADSLATTADSTAIE
ncbi:MAG: transglycosylase domain-containing protein [Bacteroidota bacterium]